MSNRPNYARQLRTGGMGLLTKIRAALADPAVADELRRPEGEMSRLPRLVGNLLDMVEEGVAGRSRSG